MKPLFTVLLIASCFRLIAQNDMLSLIGEEIGRDFAIASFKTNRVINGHSIENTAKGVMDFKINHRFGPVNGGVYELFGIDQAYVRFGFDYGITDRLMVGVGRNSYEKVYDGFLKYRILRQQTGLNNIPISVSYLGNIDFKTSDRDNSILKDNPWRRAYYTQQLLIARKFNSWTSVQIMPTWVHRNLTATKAEKNDVFLIGVAARQKISKRVAINAEYTYAFPNQLAIDIVPTLSLGVDIETGGHVFQLMLTNSNGTDHRSFLTEADQKWLDGGIRFGFNVSRVFTIVKPKPIL